MKHQMCDLSLRTFAGKSPKIAASAFIDRSAVIIGDVGIGADASIWPLAVLRGDMHSISIGERSSIQDGCICHITHAGPYNPDGFSLTVGNDCTIAHSVTLHGCCIGSRVLIGMSSTVMDGATIENDVVLGANSLVPPGKTLVSGYLYVGSPAKQIRPLSADEMAYFTYSSANYVKLKNAYLNEDETK